MTISKQVWGYAPQPGGVAALPGALSLSVEDALPVFIDGHVGVLGNEQEEKIPNDQRLTLVPKALKGLLNGVGILPKPVGCCLECVQRRIVSLNFDACHIVTREVHSYQQVDKALAFRQQPSGQLAHLGPLSTTREHNCEPYQMYPAGVNFPMGTVAHGSRIGFLPELYKFGCLGAVGRRFSHPLGNRNRSHSGHLRGSISQLILPGRVPARPGFPLGRN